MTEPRSYVPAAGRDWLLPLYDPLQRLLGDARIKAAFIETADIRPTSAFPVDPANEAGFDNSGESLTMSPALLKKYLGAARQVAEHLVMTPTDAAFAPHPVVTDTDRDKYCVKRIVAFYQRQRTDLADYFFVCWQHRQAAGSIGNVGVPVGAVPLFQASPTLQTGPGTAGIDPERVNICQF